MISAQNPLPRLSGNKILMGVLAGCLASGLLACTVLYPPVEPDKEKSSAEKTQEDTVQQLIKRDTTQHRPDTIVRYDTVWLEDVYDVALILPFHLDSLRPSNKEKEIFPRSLLALRFYTGVRLAIDRLRRKDINMRLRVYDSDKTSGQMKDILERPEMQQMDYIIGPLYPFYLQYSASFGKKHKIPVASPLSADTSVTHKNDYYMMMSPSVRAHTQRLVDHIKDSLKCDNLLVLHNERSALKEEEKSFLRYFYRMMEQTEDSARTFQVDTLASSQPSDSLLQLHIDSTDTNAVFLPSLQEDYVYYAFSQLDRLRDSFHINRVYGPPSWMNYKSIDFEYLNHLNVHTTSSYWLDYKTPRLREFRDRYIQKYNALPSRFAYIGYDVFAFITEICLHYGKYFQHSTDSVKRVGFGNQFQLKSVAIKDTVERYENKHVRLFEFDDFKIREINH